MEERTVGACHSARAVACPDAGFENSQLVTFIPPFGRRTADPTAYRRVMLERVGPATVEVASVAANPLRRYAFWTLDQLRADPEMAAAFHAPALDTGHQSTDNDRVALVRDRLLRSYFWVAVPGLRLLTISGAEALESLDNPVRLPDRHGEPTIPIYWLFRSEAYSTRHELEPLDVKALAMEAENGNKLRLARARRALETSESLESAPRSGTDPIPDDVHSQENGGRGA